MYKVDNQLRKRLREDKQTQLLKIIPGKGVITAHIILAEVGDINRFSTQHKSARYVGIILSLYQSGQMLHQGRITKQGNKILQNR